MNHERTSAMGFLDVHEFLKGVMKELWRIPAFQRSFSDPNIRKMIHCRCWYQVVLNVFSCAHFFLGYVSDVHFHSPIWCLTLSKIKSHQPLVGSKSLQMYYGSGCDEDAKPDKKGFGAETYAQYSIMNFSKHPQLDKYRRTGKVSFVQCKK